MHKVELNPNKKILSPSDIYMEPQSTTHITCTYFFALNILAGWMNITDSHN